MKTLKLNLTLSFILLIAFFAGAQNVGIGTATPVGKLTIMDSVQTSIVIKNIDNDKNTGIMFQNLNDNNSWNLFREYNGVNNQSDFVIKGGLINMDYNLLQERLRFLSVGGTELKGGDLTISGGNTIVSEDIHVEKGAIFNESGGANTFRVEGSGNPNAFYVNGLNDRVGIGTDTPSHTLDVIGDVQITQGAVINEGGGLNDFRVESVDDTHAFFVDATSDYIGMGTDVPAKELHLHRNTGLNISLKITNTNTGNLETDGISIGLANSENMFIENHEEKDIFFKTFGSERGRIFANGDWRLQSSGNNNMLFLDSANDKIGMGTNTPTEELHIHKHSPDLEVVAIKLTNINTGVTVNDGLTIGLNPLDHAVIENFENKDIFLKTNGTERARFFANGNMRMEGSSNQNMLFIKASTNQVGIGTDTPSHKLDVNGDFSVATSAIFNESGGANDFRVESVNDTHAFYVDATSDFIGMGTNTPTEELHIHKNTGAAVSLKITNTNTGNLVTDGLSIGLSSSENALIENHENKDIVFKTFGSERGRIFANGDWRLQSNSNTNMLFVDDANDRIGIGTGSPSHKLDVNGDFKVATSAIFNESGGANDFTVESNANSNMLFVKGSTDRIGLGTANPSATLHINGKSGDAPIRIQGNGATFPVGITQNNIGGVATMELTTADALGEQASRIVLKGNAGKADINFYAGASGSEEEILRIDGTGYLSLTHKAVGPVPSDVWGFEINNPSSTNRGGIRLTNNGFIHMTNVANTGNPDYAILNNMGEWTVSSDRRLKSNIKKSTGLLSKAINLNPVNYHYKHDESLSNHLGFIAQEVDEVFPEFVTKGEYLSLNYAGLSVVAIGAIKELNEKVERLEKALANALKTNNDLTSRVDSIEEMKASLKSEIMAELNAEKL